MLNDLSMQIAGIVGIIGGTGFIFGVLYKIYKVIHRLDSAIGVDESGRTMSERMERVEYQLWENGGESMKDKMNETADLAKQTSVEVSFIKEVLLQLLQMPGITPELPTPPKPRKKKTTAA